MNDLLKKFENESLKKLKETHRKSRGLDFKDIIIECLSNKKMDKQTLQVKGSSLWFTKTNITPTQIKYEKAVVSIGNSYDTMKSNYNFEDKIKGDDRLNKYKFSLDDNGQAKLTAI